MILAGIVHFRDHIFVLRLPQRVKKLRMAQKILKRLAANMFAQQINRRIIDPDNKVVSVDQHGGLVKQMAENIKKLQSETLSSENVKANVSYSRHMANL